MSFGVLAFGDLCDIIQVNVMRRFTFLWCILTHFNFVFLVRFYSMPILGFARFQKLNVLHYRYP